jgi:hypothetical protein
MITRSLLKSVFEVFQVSLEGGEEDGEIEEGKKKEEQEENEEEETLNLTFT